MTRRSGVNEIPRVCGARGPPPIDHFFRTPQKKSHRARLSPHGSHIISLNPLQNVPPDERWKVTADIVSVFSDIWKLGPETPRLLYYLRAAVRLSLDSPSTTLLDTRRTLTDDGFRSRLLRRCTDNETRQTWDEFSHKKEQQQTIEISSLQNKVAALAAPDPLRYVLGQPTSTIDIARVMRSGTPLVLDLSELGDEPAAILGAIVINQIKQCADKESRSEIAPAAIVAFVFVFLPHTCKHVGRLACGHRDQIA